MNLFNLSIRRLALVIEGTVDLVGVDDTAHGKRVGVMARDCAKAYGCGEAEQVLLFEAGLLHDCGVSSTRIHKHLVSELDWAGADAHCLRGSQLLAQFPPLAHFAPLVRHHHSHWADLLRTDIPRDIAWHSNLIYLVDRVDTLSGHLLAKLPDIERRAEIRRRIAAYAGEYFAPDWVEAFLQASADDIFWAKLNAENLAKEIAEVPQAERECTLDLPQLRAFSVLVAQIVDAKSSYTAEHSLGVARLAKRVGELANLPAETNDKLEIAGLLHDIGKLQIPDEILDKPSALDEDELEIMKSHSLITWQILKPLDGIEEIVEWAAFHHESLNGVGYPFHLQGDELCLEARIIRIADIYQAMAQQRPYRDMTPPAEILALLRDLAAQGEVDSLVVDLIATHLEYCHEAALSAST